MQLINYIIFVFFILSVQSICLGSEVIIMNGELIFANGGKQIKKIDLSRKKMESVTVYESKENSSTINQITKFNDRMFFFSEKPIRKPSIIYRYNLIDGKTEGLLQGKFPCYIKAHNKMFFYTSAMKQGVLQMIDMEKIEEPVQITTEPSAIKLPNGIIQVQTSAVVPISHDEVIFSGDQQLWIYNIVESKLKKTEILNCQPIIWREKTSQILCEEKNTYEVYLINIKNNIKRYIPKLKGIYGVVYIPEFDIIIYGRTKYRFPIGERCDIYSYSFIDKKEILIKRNDRILSGIWIKK